MAAMGSAPVAAMPAPASVTAILITSEGKVEAIRVPFLDDLYGEFTRIVLGKNKREAAREQVSGVEPFYPRHTECPWVGWLAVNEMEPEAFGLSYNERATHLFADTTTALYGDVLVTLRLEEEEDDDSDDDEREEAKQPTEAERAQRAQRAARASLTMEAFLTAEAKVKAEQDLAAAARDEEEEEVVDSWTAGATMALAPSAGVAAAGSVIRMDPTPLRASKTGKPVMCNRPLHPHCQKQAVSPPAVTPDGKKWFLCSDHHPHYRSGR